MRVVASRPSSTSCRVAIAEAGEGSGKEAGREVEKEERTAGRLRVAVICGGPSEERGISLNSARSVVDHLEARDVEIKTYYVDPFQRVFAIPTTQMYSNTPADFDFKLRSMASPFPSLPAFAAHLSHAVDIVFPVIHGKFGEDGGIQALLEQHGIPFVGTSAAAARNAFDKYACAQHMKRCGFPTLPSFLIQAGVNDNNGDVALADWFTSNGLSPDSSSVVVKPARAGSSVGVSVCSGAKEASQKARELISEGVDDRVVVEVFAAGGKEFTAIVLEAEAAADGAGGEDGSDGTRRRAVCLIPTQVELTGFAAAPATTAAAESDGADSDSDCSGDIFDYRRKYLPTQQVLYSTPPRFPPAILSSLRASATRLFSSLSLRDCARLDGWFLPPSSPAYSRVLSGLRASSKLRGGGKEVNEGGDKEAAYNEDSKQGEGEWEEEYKEGIVVFSDVNIVSGMEQTSFLFQQAALTSQFQDSGQWEEWEEEYKEGIVVFSDANIVSGMEQNSFLFQQAALTSQFQDSGQWEEWEEEYKEGIVVFSDVNIVSGMEQTSFLFQQAALVGPLISLLQKQPSPPHCGPSQLKPHSSLSCLSFPRSPQVGLSHSLILRWILASACSRYDLPLPLHPPPASPGVKRMLKSDSSITGEEGGGGEAGVSGGRRQLVWVLFGGSTAERQVSLISGTNVWLKLRACPQQLVWVLFGGSTAERQVSLISGTNVWLKLRACPQ
ncbi:unnamed protein product, partial [Closterium sp. Naga37s-1]